MTTRARALRAAEAEPDAGLPCSQFGLHYVSIGTGAGDGRVAVAVRVCPSHYHDLMQTVACIEATLGVQGWIVSDVEVNPLQAERCEWMRGARR